MQPAIFHPKALEAIRSFGILVFHAFEKKAQKTPTHELELGRKRLLEMS